MGQWNPNMRDAHYSAKLPMGPIRKLAGYKSKNKMYFNTRTSVEVPLELMKMAPLGFAHDMLELMIEHGVASDYPTATSVLKFFQEMNKILFQDAARLMLMDGEFDEADENDKRHLHPMFDELPCFKSEEFKTFKVSMKEAIANEKNPLDASLETVIPGLHQWHHENHTALKLLDAKVSKENKELRGSIKKGFEMLEESIREDRQEREQALSAVFLQLAESLSPSKKRKRSSTGEDGYNDPSSGDQAIDLLRKALSVGAKDSNSNDDNNNNDIANSNEEEEEWLAPVHRDFRMASKHSSLRDMYDEWYGLGKYDDGQGGVEKRDVEFGSKWRKHINNNFHSRTKRVVKAIDQKKDCLGDLDSACSELQPFFETCGRSVAKLVPVLQEQGLLPKAKPRGKKQTQ